MANHADTIKDARGAFVVWIDVASSSNANAFMLVHAGELLDVAEELSGKLAEIRSLVDKQAEDESLWALNLDGTVPISEAYLRRELRRLHALVETQWP